MERWMWLGSECLGVMIVDKKSFNFFQIGVAGYNPKSYFCTPQPEEHTFLSSSAG